MERKFFAHFLDTNFDTTYENTSYQRLGKDLEEYNYEVNAQVETKSNIIGEQSSRITGYETSSSVDPVYIEHDDPLSEQLWKIYNNRSTGDDCRTSIVDVLLKGDDTDADPVQVWAYRQDAIVALQTIGGDTSGVQGTFEIYPDGERVKGTFDMSTKKFTPTGAGA